MHPDPVAHVLEQGADIVIRAGWKGARWLSEDGKPFDILAALKGAESAGVLDRPIWIGRKKAAPPALIGSSPSASPQRRPRSREPKRGAQRNRKATQYRGGTPAAAELVILVASLDAYTFSTSRIRLSLYRARCAHRDLAFQAFQKPHRASGVRLGEDPERCQDSGHRRHLPSWLSVARAAPKRA